MFTSSDMSYKCDHCDFTEKKINHMSTHIRVNHPDNIREHECPHCNKFYSQIKSLEDHEQRCIKKPGVTNKKKRTEQYLDNLQEIKMRQQIDETEKKTGWVSDVFEDIFINMDNFNEENNQNLKAYIWDNITEINKQLVHKFNGINAIMFICVIETACKKFDNKKETFNDITYSTPSTNQYAISELQFKEKIETSLNECISKFEDTVVKDSGLIFQALENIKFIVTKFSTNSRSLEENTSDNANIFHSAGSWFEMPEAIKNKKYKLNIKNMDNKCFLYCLTAHFLKLKNNNHPERPTHYTKYLDKWNLPTNCDVSEMSKLQLESFERLNNVSINVFQLKDNIEYLSTDKVLQTRKQTYSYINRPTEEFNEDIDEEDLDDTAIEDGDDENYIQNDKDFNHNTHYQNDLFLPYYCSKYEPKTDGSGFKIQDVDCSNRRIYLLLMRKYYNTHFVLITDIEHFFQKKRVCPNCLTSKFDQRYTKKFNTHVKLCKEGKTRLVKMPEKGINDYVSFKDWGLTHPLEHFLVFDFETTQVDYNDETTNNTKIIRKQVPNTYGMYYSTPNIDKNEYYTFDHEDPLRVRIDFISQVKQYAKKTFDKLIEVGDNVFEDSSDNWTLLDQQFHESAIACQKCRKIFDQENWKNQKMLHHCHFTGKYLATVCGDCNNKMKNKKLLPVLAHNLRGFDSKLFIKDIAKDPDVQLSVIPLSSEKFISFDMKIKFPTGKDVQKKKWNKEQQKYVTQYEMNEEGIEVPIMVPGYATITCRFLDSFAFMASSLEALIENNKLQTESDYKTLDNLKDTFKFTFEALKKQYYLDENCQENYFTEDDILLLLQKGIYPYTYITDYWKLRSTNEIPAIQEFESDLSGRTKSRKDNIKEIKRLFKWKLFYPYQNRTIKPDFLNLYYYELELDEVFRINFDLMFKRIHEEKAKDPEMDQRVLVEKLFFEQLDDYIKDWDDDRVEYFVKELDHHHAKYVFKRFKCKDLLEYHHLYLIIDVLPLADICRNFKEQCLKSYGIEPYYKYGLPGVAWNALHKQLFEERINKPTIDTPNGIQENKPMELITDDTMRLLLDKGRRGGNCGVSIRELTKNKDENRIEDEDIIYIDANNLYGWAMCQPLPYSDFYLYDEDNPVVQIWNRALNTPFCFINNYNEERQKYWNKKTFQSNNEWDFKSMIVDAMGMSLTKGYFVTCDIELPEGLHEYFSDYPLFPENQKVTKEMKSPWQREQEHDSGVEKLLLTLQPKKGYTAHIKLLALGVKLGYKISNITAITEFNERSFIKNYIEMNTRFRNEAKTEFEKDYFKAMNNIIYGKMCQKKMNILNINFVIIFMKHKD